MKIYYKTTRLEKLCTNEKYALSKLGSVKANILWQRVSQLKSAVSLEDINNLRGPRLHWLKGNRSNQLSLDLLHPERLLITPRNNESQLFKDICEVEITEIKDTH